MASVQLSDCYYGTALSWLFRNKIQPALIMAGEKRQEYGFTTNNSKKDFALFLMYRMERKNLKEGYSSWSFGDIRGDIADLEKYIDQGKNPVLALICLKKELKGTEIAFLFQEDILKIKDKSSVTINRKKNEKRFRILLGGKRDNSVKIDCDPNFETIDL